MPYVAPIYSAEARVLAVFRDPGPKTQQGSGSGMLSMENNDPSAELCMAVQTGAGLTPSDLCPWNITPWYVNRAPMTAELDEDGRPTLTAP